jgi:hypothetical protein
MVNAIITPLPLKPDFQALVMKAESAPKDPTAAQRQRRRQKQKAAEAVTLPPAPPVTPIPAVTKTGGHGGASRCNAAGTRRPAVDAAAYAVALALAGMPRCSPSAAWSCSSPGAPQMVVSMARAFSASCATSNVLPSGRAEPPVIACRHVRTLHPTLHVARNP